MSEVAPQEGARGKVFLDALEKANADANHELMRLALKLATGAGKTTVMAMLIAWQTINAVRHPQSRRFTRGFLIVAPGITIKDRLRVLQPNDPDNYYKTRELVPADIREELTRAKIVITNYHAFKLREQIELSKGGRALLQGRGEMLNTLENDGQMLQRVMPELMGLKNVVVFNDEAHHCYREKANAQTEELKGEERQEAEKNTEAARVWISGLEAVNRKLGVLRVIDLSATPFFLSGSGYAEGTLFPWTVSDFSLMDAIECGIVKLPRVPISDNIPEGETPMFRNLWDHIGKDLPKKSRTAAGDLNWDSPYGSPFRVRAAQIRPRSGAREGAESISRWRKSRGAPELVKMACFRVIRAQISRLFYRRRWSLDQDVHGAVSGGERRADIRLRISANRVRGIATSAI